MGRKQRHLTPEEMADILQNTMVEEETTLWDDFKQLCRWILMIFIGIITIIIVALYAGNDKNNSSSAKPTIVSTEPEKAETTVPSSNSTKNITTPQEAVPKAKPTIKSETTSNRRFEQKIVDDAIEKVEKQRTTQIQNYNSVESAPETVSDKEAKQQAKAQRKVEKEQRRAERKAKRQANNREE